jgi:hypothetical protein
MVAGASQNLALVVEPLVSSVVGGNLNHLLRIGEASIHDSARGGHLAGVGLLIQEDVLHAVLLVPHSLLHDLPQGAQVQTLEGVQVDAILGVRVVAEDSGHFGEVLRRRMVEGGLVWHGHQGLPGWGLRQPLVMHRPTDLTHIIRLCEMLLIRVRVAERHEMWLLPRLFMR